MPSLIGIGPNGDLHFYGSCFIAHRHMAVTARHVVDELIRQDPSFATGYPKLEYWVLQTNREQRAPKYVVWTIDSIATSPHSDIAIIWLKSWNDHAAEYDRWKVVPITFEIPREGEEILAFGIHGVSFEGSRTNDEGKVEHVEYKDSISISRGTVKNVYWEGRDRGMYNFPCFEVNAKFEHGMSGGLILNMSSQVCGIVCGSLAAMSPEDSHVSYAAMLWPMMAIPLGDHLVVGGEPTKAYRLMRLAKDGIFRPKGWDRVLIEENDSVGMAPRISLRSDTR